MATKIPVCRCGNRMKEGGRSLKRINGETKVFIYYQCPRILLQDQNLLGGVVIHQQKTITEKYSYGQSQA